MKRYFLQPYPTFGSYANPIQYKVESSPYFWWWLALTMSDEYSDFCDKMLDTAYKPATKRESQILRVYNDFGDVRYEGKRHAAFAKWWREPIDIRYPPNKHNKKGRKITRGEHLFAEAVNDSAREITISEVSSYGDSHFIIAVPKASDKSQAEAAVLKIIGNHLASKAGRAARDPKYSTAQYPLSRSTVPSAMKKAFKLYWFKQDAMKNGSSIANPDLPTLAKVEMTTRTRNDEIVDVFAKRLSDGNAVTRYLRQAKGMIDNATIGIFP
jgi:hypothetical protein